MSDIVWSLLLLINLTIHKAILPHGAKAMRIIPGFMSQKAFHQGGISCYQLARADVRRRKHKRNITEIFSLRQGGENGQTAGELSE